MEVEKNQSNNASESSDTTPKVTGIGGIFFNADNLEDTKAWYAKNLGIEINNWGSSIIPKKSTPSNGNPLKKKRNISLLPKKSL